MILELTITELILQIDPHRTIYQSSHSNTQAPENTMDQGIIPLYKKNLYNKSHFLTTSKTLKHRRPGSLTHNMYVMILSID